MNSRRTNTRVLEDAGDIIRGVNLVDVSASESNSIAVHYSGSPIPWVPAAWPGTPLYDLRVKSIDQQGPVVNHQLETILGRLTRIYPRGVVAAADEITASPPAAGVTVQQVITFVLNRWRMDFPWLDFAPVPVMRVNTSSGYVTPRVQAIALKQEPGRERSARQLLDSMLSLFTGYVLRVNAIGRLEIIAPPTSTSKTVPASQVFSVQRSTAVDDIVNRCTVRSRQWGFSAAPATPYFTFSASANYPAALNWVSGTGDRTGYTDLGTVVQGGSGDGQWFDVPVLPNILSRGVVWLELQMDAFNRWWDGMDEAWDVAPYRNQERGYLQQVTLNGSAEEGATTLDVQPLERDLIAGSPIWFPGGVTAYTVGTHAAGAQTLNVEPLPARVDGPVTVPVSRAYSTSSGLVHIRNFPDTSHKLFIRGTATGGMQVRFEDLDLYDPAAYQRSVRYAMRFWTVDWAPTNTEVSATFGRSDNPEHVSKLPGFVTSQSQYGVVERTLDAGIANLSMEDAMSIAEAYVAANMHPRARLTLQLTPGQPVVPSDINRRVIVPNNTGGTSSVIIESWEHTEMFDNTSASVTTRVTGVIND